jgi:hypothetical protein
MTEEWQPPKDIKPWMVCAACENQGAIITGARHWDKVMHANPLIEIEGEWEQGFIDQWGRFYNRTDAMKAVMKNRQPFNLRRNGGSITELYSEGLY